VSDIIVSPSSSQLFAATSFLISFPSGTPHEISVVDGRYSVLVLCAVIYSVGEDPPNCLYGGQKRKLVRTVHSDRMYFGSMRRMIAIVERVHIQMSTPSLN
jgi:hypothetical protein